jgi:hypothetical protein
MDWWVTKGSQVPVGPVSTDLLLRGISAGAVPKDALVCKVGGSTWTWIGEMPPFSVAIRGYRTRPTLDSGDEMTAPGPVIEDESSSGVDDAPEPTTQTTMELPRHWFESMNDNEERTIVDLLPPRPSDPPTDV